jgi:hypothetical protein
LGSVFNSQGQSLGYVQGSTNKFLFNNGISHSGDDVAGSNLSSILGDNEHITIDFRRVPPEASTIVIGVLLVSGSGLRNVYLNVLPLLREEDVPRDAIGVEYDSSDSEDEHRPSPSANYLNQTDDDGDSELILLFKTKIEMQHPDFANKRGLVPFKLSRDQYGSWQLFPIRQTTNIDPQYGLWPSLERYQHQSYSQQNYGQPNSSFQQGYHQQSYGQQQNFASQQPYNQNNFGQGYGQPPYQQNYAQQPYQQQYQQQNTYGSPAWGNPPNSFGGY